MNNRTIGRGRHSHFPAHYKKVIKSNGIRVVDLSKICNISPKRLSNIMSDTGRCVMDFLEFNAIKSFVESIE